jgi:Kef-type K+ transport system membrane component KefB
MFQSEAGTVIMTAAAVDDTTGWLLLAWLSGRAPFAHFGPLAALAAGAALGRNSVVNRFRPYFGALVMALFAPLFFAFAGLKVELGGMGGFLLPAVFVAVACLSKIAGSAFGAALGGMRRWQALTVAFGMNTRGAMELVVASMGLGMGILNRASYSIVVLTAVVTTLMTPPLLRWAAARARRGPEGVGLSSAFDSVEGPKPEVVPTA